MILSDAHIQKFGFYAEPINMAEYAKKASKLTLTWLRGKIDRDRPVPRSFERRPFCASTLRSKGPASLSVL
jgi:hypothetical protein